MFSQFAVTCCQADAANTFNVAMGFLYGSGFWVPKEQGQALGNLFFKFLALYAQLQVFEAKWYAGMYGGPTCKPHIGWSNSPTVECLNLGKMTKNIRAMISSRGVKSTIVYRNSKGKKAFCGSKHLKLTGNLDHKLATIVLFKQHFFFFQGNMDQHLS